LCSCPAPLNTALAIFNHGNIAAMRPDQSDYLAHFTKGDNAINNIISILEGGIINKIKVKLKKIKGVRALYKRPPDP
jgi:hypothetical protein